MCFYVYDKVRMLNIHVHSYWKCMLKMGKGKDTIIKSKMLLFSGNGTKILCSSANYAFDQ